MQLLHGHGMLKMKHVGYVGWRLMVVALIANYLSWYIIIVLSDHNNRWVYALFGVPRGYRRWCHEVMRVT
ncbi:hypothetical protein Bca52824_067242 [Brassica carinata]|uniref:Uncharacterized protein n=1 Tax=Brassica carinata TaxID=52824 RepID=A0A8X7UBK1_BRACI|nr:hypothetical protein Bca52824_067242 [Brassica carinata]